MTGKISGSEHQYLRRCTTQHRVKSINNASRKEEEVFDSSVLGMAMEVSEVVRDLIWEMQGDGNVMMDSEFPLRLFQVLVRQLFKIISN